MAFAPGRQHTLARTRHTGANMQVADWLRAGCTDAESFHGWQQWSVMLCWYVQVNSVTLKWKVLQGAAKLMQEMNVGHNTVIELHTAADRAAAREAAKAMPSSAVHCYTGSAC